jgi:hypothetical protein
LLLLFKPNEGGLSLSATGVTEKSPIFMKRVKTTSIIVVTELPLYSLAVIASE